VTRVLLLRHAEPLVSDEMPAARWPLSARGLDDAGAVGARLAEGSRPTVVWTSPERKARETAARAFPSVHARVRRELVEVTKPWYRTPEQHAAAAAGYLGGESLHGWESRVDVSRRLGVMEAELEGVERTAFVSHGMLLTLWVDHVIGLEDPFAFWSGLRHPDAWELDLDARSLERIA
jgi:broad specificity phosphatase PhoE